jgi:hypothetical protein
MQGVITGDIVNSTKLGSSTEKKLLRKLNEVLAPYKFEFYRGDSFQVYQADATQCLKTALLCRAAAISLSKEDEEKFDIRLGIGIGETQTPVRNLSTAKGEAFLLSGRALDAILASEVRLSMATGNSLANEGLQVLSAYMNAIFKGMTAKQAAVIFELLKGQTQQVVAKKLKKSKSTINQHVNAGRWEEIAQLLIHYENIIKNIL